MDMNSEQTLEAFKLECYKLAIVRRRKWRKKGSERFISHHWECIGDGYYSEVWQHEHYRGLVCKISGRAGWGYDRDPDYSKCKTNEVLDAWVEYAKYCMTATGRHVKYLPKIHHIEQMSEGMHWAIMKCYDSARYMDYDLIQPLRMMMHRAKWAIKMRAHIEDVVGDTSIDLHGGNMMYDSALDLVVVTDPLSTTPQDAFIDYND